MTSIRTGMAGLALAAAAVLSYGAVALAAPAGRSRHELSAGLGVDRRSVC